MLLLETKIAFPKRQNDVCRKDDAGVHLEHAKSEDAISAEIGRDELLDVVCTLFRVEGHVGQFEVTGDEPTGGPREDEKDEPVDGACEREQCEKDVPEPEEDKDLFVEEVYYEDARKKMECFLEGFKLLQTVG